MSIVQTHEHLGMGVKEFSVSVFCRTKKWIRETKVASGIKDLVQGPLVTWPHTFLSVPVRQL